MPRVPLFKASKLDWSHTVARPGPNPMLPIGRGLQQLGEGIQSFQRAHDAKKNRLYLLGKKNSLVEQRLEEIKNLRESRKLGQAKDAFSDERTRVNDEYEMFMEDVPEKVRADAANIFYSTNAQHLGRVLTHELTQTEEWTRNEAVKEVSNAGKLALEVPLGSFKQVFRVVDDMTVVLKDYPIKDPTKAIVHSRDVIDKTFATWARINPQAAEQALLDNGLALQDRMGQDFNKLLGSLETGRQIYERRQEYNFRWDTRNREKKYEGTIKAGVIKFLNPKERLDIDWIEAQGRADTIDSGGMRILYSLLQAQNAETTLTEDGVDWPEYWRLSKIVRNRLTRGYNYDTVALDIAKAANVSITSGMAKSMLNSLANEQESTPEQRKAYALVENMQFHQKNKKLDVAMRNQTVYQLDLWIERHPDQDPRPWLEDTILKGVKDDLTEWYFNTWGTGEGEGAMSGRIVPENIEMNLLEETLKMGAYATEEEETEIGNFFLKHQDIPYNNTTRELLLNRLRTGGKPNR